MADDISTQDKDEAGRREWVSEELWHIRNATTDLSQFMQPLPVGTQITSADIFDSQGAACELDSLWSDLPVLLITGSISCPPSRVFNPSLNELNDEFGKRFNLAILYVIDAHPSGDPCPYTGTDWITTDNEEAGLLVRQPIKLEQRIQLANRYIDELGLEVPVYVDNMNDTAWIALGRSPNMAVLINTQGQVSLYQDWFRPDALRELLQQYEG